MKDFELFRNMCGLNPEELDDEEKWIKLQVKHVSEQLAKADTEPSFSEDDCINAARRLTDLAARLKQVELMKQQSKVFDEYEKSLKK